MLAGSDVNNKIELKTVPIYGFTNAICYSLFEFNE